MDGLRHLVYKKKKERKKYILYFVKLKLKIPRESLEIIQILALKMGRTGSLLDITR